MRALLISYAFPPVGGAGVQRMLKLVKYLPEHGVRPSVLTVENPSVPVQDASLLDEIPAATTVLRARTWEPAYAAKALAWRARAAPDAGLQARLGARVTELARSVLLPDPQVLWLPGAARTLRRCLREAEPIDAVLVSGPPFSSHLLALLARLRPGVGVVLDYRDEWTTTKSTSEMAASVALDAVLERACLRAAHAVTTATEAFRRELLARFAFLDGDDVITIENGYDPADFQLVRPALDHDHLVLTYTGTVFRLTSAAGLIEGLRSLHRREPELARRIETRFVGRIVGTEEKWFEASEALGVRRVGYLSHAEAIRELARAHVALCILDACPGAERVYPAKIFEIMALRRPCLALCPEGVLADLVRRQRLGDVVPPRDANRIATVLAELARRFQSGDLPAATEPLEPERYDRRAQAGRFARVLERAWRSAQARAGAPVAGPAL